MSIDDDYEQSEEQVGIIFPKTNLYLHSLLRPRDQVLKDIERDAEKNNVPIIGPLVGNLLFILASSCKAKKVLEIGTATGYSGIWLARAIAENGGKLVTIELDPQRIKKARANFERAGFGKNVEILSGDAGQLVLELVRKSKKEFDIVLLDIGEKKIYAHLLDACVSLLRDGGFLIADNVLWGGYVADPSDKDSYTEIVRKFNKMVYADKRLLPVIIPLRDGVLVAQKVSSKKKTD